jgi:hypothetical protein
MFPVHIHQQNASVERKHCHIVETGLALLAHAHIPIKFWDDAFLTATFLINRMPARVLDNTSPIERLLHTPPNYSMMRVFDCACWPHLRAYNNHKLSFCSKECVFLSYSSMHKGYKCLDRESGQVYVSRDVIFDEHVFPFHRDFQNSDSTDANIHNLHLDNSTVNLSYDHMLAPLPAEDPVASSLGFMPQPQVRSSSTGVPMIGAPDSSPDSAPAPSVTGVPLIGTRHSPVPVVPLGAPPTDSAPSPPDSSHVPAVVDGASAASHAWGTMDSAPAQNDVGGHAGYCFCSRSRTYTSVWHSTKEQRSQTQATDGRHGHLFCGTIIYF